MKNPVVQVRGLCASYSGVTALESVNFEIDAGTMTAIVGPNGAGKSTLLTSMLGLQVPDSGTVTFFGQPIGQVRKDVAYVPQRSTVDWTFPISVLGTVLQGTYPRLGLMRRPSKADRELALKCLETVGISDLSQRQIGGLSGGQQQRMFLARALAQQAQLIILDEPFAGVDVTSEALIVEVLHDLRSQGITVMVVHHDLTTVNQYYDHALLLNKFVISHGTVGKTLTKDLLGQAYHPELYAGLDS